INIALVRAFVCCGIPFSVIDNPFFRELLYQLQANYGPPSRQTLAGQLLSKEISKVNLKIDQELSNAENLTLEYERASNLLSECLKIIKYYKKSHICNSLLSNAAETFSIRGGGLQPFVKTRWTSIYESTNSILRMHFALNEIVRNHSDEITSKSVKKILRRR
ncbi:6181_t:CDS:2, partial [Entrophospora sp. SA101]